jgi:hypothetical protein
MPGLWWSKVLAGVVCALALLIVTILSAPAWLVGPFLPQHQDAVNERLNLLITWTGIILDHPPVVE